MFKKILIIIGSFFAGVIAIFAVRRNTDRHGIQTVDDSYREIGKQLTGVKKQIANDAGTVDLVREDMANAKRILENAKKRTDNKRV